MRLAICDDEEDTRILLAEKLRTLFPTLDPALYSSGNELLAGPPPDILLMDIQMPCQSEMEIARDLRQCSRKMLLIFVTALKEHVFQTFDVGAFHHLVKPFSDEKFAEVMANAVGQY